MQVRWVFGQQGAEGSSGAVEKGRLGDLLRRRRLRELVEGKRRQVVQDRVALHLRQS